MARAATVVTMKAALTRERRTNRRLRAVIEGLREEIKTVRAQMEGVGKVAEMNVSRLGQLQAAVDRLTAAQTGRER
jgi:hypothetical protein